MDYLIIIPTYNEAKNIASLVCEITRVMQKAYNGKYEKNYSMLVVDDNSPDKTYEIVESLMTEVENLYLLKREKKEGLGKAYIEGFKWGISKGFKYFLEMDADFSHNPVYIPELFKLIESYDFVIGSRYIKGGGIKGWGKLRKLISFGGSLYARIILNCPIKDFTGGFNLWRKEVLEEINYEQLIANGYSFQIELKYKAYKKGFKFVEYPIIFVDRKIGKSKMSKKIFFEAILNVWKYKFKIK